MNDKYETYRIWAPHDAIWAPWAKPVLFSSEPPPIPISLDIPAVEWVPSIDGRSSVIVDKPGGVCVLEGLALAKTGYRPVPLYNGVHAPNMQSMAVDVSRVVGMLYQGADVLASLTLRSDAPPAFLMDANRMTGTVRELGKYDNRWCVFPQDMPSASFLIEQGIQRIYVRTSVIQNDLAHILRRYQEKKIDIYHVGDSGNITELTVVRPSQFRGLLYRIQTMMGLTRNATGGFGGMVPEATQHTGGRYYGVG